MNERDDADVTPAHILELKDELLERWRQLPVEHQATLVLVLLKEVFEGEYGEWMWGVLGLLASAGELDREAA